MFDMDGSEVIDGGSVQTVEQLVYQNRLVSLNASPNCDYVAYCVKEFDQSYETKPGAINVFAHCCSTMRSVRMTNHSAGAAHSAAVVSGIAGAEDLVCFLHNGAVHCMALGGGCQARVAGGPGGEIQAFKVFSGPFNRIWLLAVMSVQVRPPADRTPSRTTGMVFDQLMVRHWTDWNAYAKRNHLHLIELMVTPEGLLAEREGRTAVDVMEGLETDCPGKAPGEGDEDFSVSPEGTLIALCCRRPLPADAAGLHAQARDMAWTTDTGIYLSKMSTDDKAPARTEPPVLISGDARTYNHCPSFSPSGRYLAYLSTDRPGYESDKQSIRVYDTATLRTHTLALGEEGSPIDLSFGGLCWAPDSTEIFSTAVVRGVNRIVKLSLGGVAASAEEDTGDKPVFVRSLLTMRGVRSYAEPRVVRTQGGDFLYYMQSSLTSPVELMRLQLSSPTSASVGSSVFCPLAEYDSPCDWRDLSDCADNSQGQLRAQYVYCPCPQYSNGDIAAAAITETYFAGARGEPVHAYYLPPVGAVATEGRSVPLLLIVHGGPQGAIMNSWNYRWNMSLFAAQGYGVLAVNFHGSVGYGQAFTDSIRGDWGNGPYQDCLLGVEHALRRHAYLDPERVAALGASYGGYMINWMNGHTDRFKCLVNHDGIFSLQSLYYVTEELWFPEWEFGLPWTEEGKAEYRKWSPDEFVGAWKTPTLVVQGGRDYRVCEGEGIATFTALQRRGVPSRLLFFEDEGHWVLKPQNSEMWYRTVFGWLEQWLKK